VNPFVQMAVEEMREGIVYLDLSSCDLFPPWMLGFLPQNSRRTPP
jgi:hypothetical protein